MHALVFAAQVASTLTMFGVIWFVQVVHYPLFARVGADGFAHYASLHATRTTWVVAPPMLVELATSVALLYPPMRPGAVRPAEAWAGLLLLVVVWASTALLQVPLHDRLQRGFSEEQVRRLVRTNWVRTSGWSLRAALVSCGFCAWPRPVACC